jgi:hypothetical protein
MSDDTINEGPERRGPSRRTMLKAAAWSVPVIVVAQAAPALASVSNPVFFTLSGACKLPGNATDAYKGYAFGLTLVNSLGQSVAVYIDTMSVNADLQTIGLVEEWIAPSTCGQEWPGPGPNIGPIAVADNASRTIAVFTVNDNNSSSATLVINFHYFIGGSITPTPGTSTVSFTGSPWTGGCRPFDTTQGQDTWTSPTCTQFK